VKFPKEMESSFGCTALPRGRAGRSPKHSIVRSGRKVLYGILETLSCILVAVVVGTGFYGTALADDRQAALGQLFPTLIPPAEYDHAFVGVVMVRRLDKEALAKRCVVPNALGCAHHNGPTCEVTIGNDELLVWNDIRVPWQAIYRHEIAHCNGWPWNHPMRPIPVAREVLPPLTAEPIPTKPVPVQVIRIDGPGISSSDFRALMRAYAARRAKERGFESYPNTTLPLPWLSQEAR
jgi:hypothetical protein